MSATRVRVYVREKLKEQSNLSHAITGALSRRNQNKKIEQVNDAIPSTSTTAPQRTPVSSLPAHVYVRDYAFSFMYSKQPEPGLRIKGAHRRKKRVSYIKTAVRALVKSTGHISEVTPAIDQITSNHLNNMAREFLARIKINQLGWTVLQASDHKVPELKAQRAWETRISRDRFLYSKPKDKKTKKAPVNHLKVGMRATKASLTRKSALCVMVTTDVIDIPGHGGTSDYITHIQNTCRKLRCPIVYALSKREASSVLFRDVPHSKDLRAPSVVSVLSVESILGAEQLSRDITVFASALTNIWHKIQWLNTLSVEWKTSVHELIEGALNSLVKMSTENLSKFVNDVIKQASEESKDLLSKEVKSLEDKLRRIVHCMLLMCYDKDAFGKNSRRRNDIRTILDDKLRLLSGPRNSGLMYDLNVVPKARLHQNEGMLVAIHTREAKPPLDQMLENLGIPKTDRHYMPQSVKMPSDISVDGINWFIESTEYPLPESAVPGGIPESLLDIASIPLEKWTGVDDYSSLSSVIAIVIKMCDVLRMLWAIDEGNKIVVNDNNRTLWNERMSALSLGVCDVTETLFTSLSSALLMVPVANAYIVARTQPPNAKEINDLNVFGMASWVYGLRFIDAVYQQFFMADRIDVKPLTEKETSENKVSSDRKPQNVPKASPASKAEPNSAKAQIKTPQPQPSDTPPFKSKLNKDAPPFIMK